MKLSFIISLTISIFLFCAGSQASASDVDFQQTSFLAIRQRLELETKQNQENFRIEKWKAQNMATGEEREVALSKMQALQRRQLVVNQRMQILNSCQSGENRACNEIKSIEGEFR